MDLIPFSDFWKGFIMNGLSRYKIGLFTAIFSICVFMLTGFFSLKAYNSSRNTEKQFTTSVQDLRKHMARLESRVKDFEKLINEKKITSTATNSKGVPKVRIDKNSKNKK